ncbi:MAG: response regulator [Candidatus Uhrbacteria bacterium]|nr:response regulator [Candidatus Uhrbacteria bacterium]
MAKVLIIEDDEFLSKIYATKLKQEGIDADFALDGVQGLEKMRANKPSLILLDLILPKKDGFGVLEEMQGDAQLKKIQVIILSNLGQESDIERGKKLGAKEFIVKSDTSIQAVVKKIKSYLK